MYIQFNWYIYICCFLQQAPFVEFKKKSTYETVAQISVSKFIIYLVSIFSWASKKKYTFSKKKYTRPWPRQPDWYIYTHSFLKRYSFMILEKVHIFQKKNLKKYGFFQKSKSQKSPLPPSTSKNRVVYKTAFGTPLGLFLNFCKLQFL